MNESIFIGSGGLLSKVFFIDINRPCYDINMVRVVMSELDNDIIEGLTEGMGIGNMVKFREGIVG